MCFIQQKSAYASSEYDWCSDMCSSDLSDEFSQEKIKWLEKHFPEIATSRGGTDMMFIKWPHDNKVAALKRICLNKNISTDNVLLIDDNLDILREANSKGIKAIHPIRVLIMKEESEYEYKRPN